MAPQKDLAARVSATPKKVIPPNPRRGVVLGVGSELSADDMATLSAATLPAAEGGDCDVP